MSIEDGIRCCNNSCSETRTCIYSRLLYRIKQIIRKLVKIRQLLLWDTDIDFSVGQMAL